MEGQGNVLVEMVNVTFSYEKKGKKHMILENVSYQFEKGKMYAVLGKSGSGKTTTLSLIGALEFPQAGKVLYRGEPVTKKNQEEYRNRIVSIIFQDYNLLPYMNGYQNIELGMHIVGRKESREWIDTLLERVGIDERVALNNVKQISGGEQQRIAIARALATDAEVILADEPTGNLDDETAAEIIELLYNLAHEEEKCVIAVTHTKALADRADAVIRIADKRLTEGL